MLTEPTQETEPPPYPAGPRRKLFSPYTLAGLVLLATALVAFAAFAGLWRHDPLTLVGPGAGSSGTVTMQLTMSGFRPKSFEARAGTEVRLKLVNAEEGYDHQFAIDELDVNYVLQPQSEQVISFTPTEPGTYTVYCDVCCGGQGNPTMRGTLKVTD